MDWHSGRVQEVPGTVLSWATYHCGLEQVTFSQLLKLNNICKLINSIHVDSSQAQERSQIEVLYQNLVLNVDLGVKNTHEC